MTEQYDIAAKRHRDVGEKLQTGRDLDDAGYHFGVSGENSVKYALEASGVVSAWLAIGAAQGRTPRASLSNTPMREHFPSLKQFVMRTQSEISTYATGRLGMPISSYILDPSFANRFDNWDINIRYADTNCTPVTAAACADWHSDADDLFLNLVI